VDLSWTVASDEDLAGFRVYRAAGSGTMGTFVALNEGLLAPDARSYRDESVVPGAEYSYLVAVVLPGGEEIRSPASKVRVTPPVLSLEQNRPNPFNPSTVIAFTLPEATRVELAIYDVQGRLVRVLRGGRAPAGRHEVEWNGRDTRGEPVSSGLYLYRLKAGTKVLTKKMVMLK
jgi:hypothetical protein